MVPSYDSSLVPLYSDSIGIILYRDYGERSEKLIITISGYWIGYKVENYEGGAV